MKHQKFTVQGMTCSACASHIERSIEKLNGIQKVQVHLLTNSMTVDYDDMLLSTGEIEKAVEKAGYKAKSAKPDKSSSQPVTGIDSAQNEWKEMRKRWWLSFTFLIPLLYISMGHMFGFPLPSFFLGHQNAITFALTQFLLTLPIALINEKYFRNGFKMLFRGAPNMDSLIALGSSAAIAYGVFAIYRIGHGMGHGDWAIVQQFSHDLYFESGATILTLVTLGKYLESKSKNRTSDAIAKLVRLTPKVATVIRNGEERVIPTEQVILNDIIAVKAGQQIPVDGIITDGHGSVDESALTGESMPVFKEKESTVLSGSINRSGFFTFRATKVGEDTTLSQIITLVEEASASKAPVSKLADRVSRIFVPVVMGISLVATVTWLALGYPFDFALSIGIAVLVISCPCALGLATPVAIMAGSGKGAEHGILAKSAEAFERGSQINTIVFDKTGTLTEGKPQTTDILPYQGISESRLLEIAGSLEKRSEHPIADAILETVSERNIKIHNVTHYTTIPGQGVGGEIGETFYLAGNLKLMQENGIETKEHDEFAGQLAEEGKTPLFIADKEKVIGILAVADRIKPTARQTIEELKKMKLEMIMLTGDNQKTASAIQQQLAISSVIAEVLPQDKDKEIARLQSSGKKVAMVGDGINDAPALTRADVGIAIGNGTDIAIESADVILMRNNVLDTVTFLKLSRAILRNIRQNLFWAFFYNIIGIPLAAGLFYSFLGWKLSPMFAAAAMSLSSITVVLNALRLTRFKPETDTITQQKTIMQRTIKIKGMSCGHCSDRVEKALNQIDGVSAKVDLETHTAHLTLERDIEEDILREAIEEAGYEMVNDI